MGAVFLWVVRLVGGAVADYVVQQAGTWLLSSLVALHIFGSAADPQGTVVKQFPQTSAVPCFPDAATGNFYVDLGSLFATDNCHTRDLGWLDDQRDDGGNWNTPYDDTSRVRLPPRNKDAGGAAPEAKLILHDVNPHTSYTIAIAALRGKCDDSFEVLVNGTPKPIFGVDAVAGVAVYGGAKVPRGVNIFAIALDQSLTARSSDFELTFVNRSNDDCGRPAFYYLWMGPTQNPPSDDAAPATQAPAEATTAATGAPPAPPRVTPTFPASKDLVYASTAPAAPGRGGDPAAAGPAGNPSTSNPQCAGTAGHYDLGGDVSLQVEGWVGVDVSLPADPNYQDTTALRMRAQASNTLTVPACANTPATVTFASGGGSCDGGFAVQVNGATIATITDPSGASPRVHRVQIPASAISGNQLTVAFVSPSTDGCDQAEVWYVDVNPA